MIRGWEVVQYYSALRWFRIIVPMETIFARHCDTWMRSCSTLSHRPMIEFSISVWKISFNHIVIGGWEVFQYYSALRWFCVIVPMETIFARHCDTWMRSCSILSGSQMIPRYRYYGNYLCTTLWYVDEKLLYTISLSHNLSFYFAIETIFKPHCDRRMRSWWSLSYCHMCPVDVLL